MEAISTFRGDYSYLSNFYIRSIIYNGIKYKSTEHAYQAMKATNKDDHDFVANSLTPGRAKQSGQSIPCRQDWNNIKIQVMHDIVKAKFEQHADLKELLLSTNDTALIEGNNWKDTYWGICDGKGENNLGKILMSIRDSLKKEVMNE